MSDSDFEEIGYSDLDSHTGGGEEKAKCTKAKVVVELPPQLINASKPYACLSNNISSDGHVKKEFKVDSDSSQSSFIPVTRLNGLNIEEGDKSAESWTKVYGDKNCSSASYSNLESNASVNSLSTFEDYHGDEVSANSSTITGFHLFSCNEKRGKKRAVEITDLKSTSNDDVASVYSSNSATTNATLSVSSVISGFDILSLNGTRKRRCRRCTFFNHENCTICECCSAALVANPSLDMDEQIALNLHQQEERDAFQEIIESENRRNNISSISLLEQSNFLADDIRSCIRTKAFTGVEVLSAIDLRLHISRFIEYYKIHTESCLKIGYYFSSKFENGYNSIRVKGFGTSFNIDQDVESAYKRENPRFNELFSINENSSSIDDTDKLGWIVATFNGTQNQGELDDSIWVEKSSQCIPLATFDASMRSNETVKETASSLLNIIQDFFLFLGMQIPDQSVSNKRLKMDQDFSGIELTPRAITQKCLPVLQRLLSDQFGWVFRDPVDPDILNLPDYFEIVKNPMHLSLIEEKLQNNGYNDAKAVERDTKLVFENAILYNGHDSEVGEMAQTMIDRFQKDFNEALNGKIKSSSEEVKSEEKMKSNPEEATETQDVQNFTAINDHSLLKKLSPEDQVASEIDSMIKEGSSDLAISVLVNFMKEKNNSATAQEYCLGKLWDLCVNCDENKTIFLSNNFLEETILAMKKFSNNAKIQEQACRLIWSLCTTEERRKTIIRSGAITSIFLALKNHMNVEDLVATALSCLQTISRDPEARRYIHEMSGVEHICKVMKIHRASPGIQRDGCKILSDCAVGLKGREATLISECFVDFLQNASQTYADPRTRRDLEKALQPKIDNESPEDKTAQISSTTLSSCCQFGPGGHPSTDCSSASAMSF